MVLSARALTGAGPLQFASPDKMCFTVREARPLLLVAENDNDRVQAVDVVDRAHAAFLFVGQACGEHVT